MPLKFIGRPFREVFVHFVHVHRLVPIGIYRAETTASRSSLTDGPARPAPYCYTNPLPTAQLARGDQIFVVGNPSFRQQQQKKPGSE